MKLYDRAPKKKRHPGRAVLLVVLALLAAGLLDSHFRIVTTRYDLSYADLPQSFESFRAVQISDFHLTELGKNNSRLLAAVAAQNEENRQAVLRAAGSLGKLPAEDYVHEELAWRLEA